MPKIFKRVLKIKFLQYFFKDVLAYSEKVYDSFFKREKYINGFILYRKYSRKDVFRILNWDQNPVAQNVGGYIVSSDKTNCPIFVNYHKEEDISDTIKYDDGFISNYEFQWMSKSKRTKQSPDVRAIQNYRQGLRLLLFIKKHNGESNDFYYMGDVTPLDESIEETTMADKKVPVVKMILRMKQPVEDSIYEYLIKENA